MMEKNENKIPDSLKPKLCLDKIPMEIRAMIEQVKWVDFETAYGNAEKTIPYYLENLFCTDESTAMDATHQLWCSLCHQHAYVSDASLPSYNILKLGLLRLNDDLKVEILDIFAGFAGCIRRNSTSNDLLSWEKQLQQNLLQDRNIFAELAISDNETMRYFAGMICESLNLSE
jgi:hypothetical protein